MFGRRLRVAAAAVALAFLAQIPVAAAAHEATAADTCATRSPTTSRSRGCPPNPERAAAT
jgi:hypothetical protein